MVLHRGLRRSKYLGFMYRRTGNLSLVDIPKFGPKRLWIYLNGTLVLGGNFFSAVEVELFYDSRLTDPK